MGMITMASVSDLVHAIFFDLKQFCAAGDFSPKNSRIYINFHEVQPP